MTDMFWTFINDRKFSKVTSPSGFSEYGGMDLDFSYNMAFAEELGSINAGGVTSAFGVHTDMATPAFSK